MRDCLHCPHPAIHAFAALVQALEAGDYREADRYRKELLSFGFVLTFRDVKTGRAGR